MFTFYEFFAGGGMARAGLGPNWDCLLANDIDPKKAASYAANWGAERLRVADVGTLTSFDLPGHADLAWASFPCQDLSLAGDYAGLKGSRSGTFWLFWRIIKDLVTGGRAPSMIVLENVCGALTSHEGRDFAALGSALSDAGYRFGALVIDASRFVPQSRPRLFIVAVRRVLHPESNIVSGIPDPAWHPANLIGAYRKLSDSAKAAWVWWKLPQPPPRQSVFSDLIEDQPEAALWHSAEQTQNLLQMMSDLNLRKVEQARRMGRRIVGGLYRRTRVDATGQRHQRAEVRFDDIAGCLRTPAGGSSRQTILIVDGTGIRSRLLSSREAARLMGLPDTYLLPEKYNDAYHLLGDGVVAPAVRFLAQHILEPALTTEKGEKEAA